MPQHFLHVFKANRRRIIWGAILLLLAGGFVSGAYFWEKAQKADITIYFFDVGQGDAIFIESYDGTQILIDGGPPNQILPKLGEVLPYFDHSLDAIVLTHPHTDHVSGLIEVLARYEVKTVIESGASYHTSEAVEFKKAVSEEGARRIIVDSQVEFSFYDGAKLKFLLPDKSYESAILKNVHDSALVSELDYKGKRILFMSDAEKNIEEKLARDGRVGDVDVLKVGHHGSKTSSQEIFLKTAKPEYAIISLGRNRYGHPHPDVLNRLASVGAKILRTDTEGTIILEIRNDQLILRAEK